MSEHPAAIGNLAEVRFVHDALALGYSPSVPWGNQPGYDAILTHGSRSFRVQIKTVARVRPGHSKHWVNLQGTAIYKTSKKRAPVPGCYDILAVWLRDEEAWVFVREVNARKQCLSIPQSVPRDDWAIFQRRR